MTQRLRKCSLDKTPGLQATALSGSERSQAVSARGTGCAGCLRALDCPGAHMAFPSGGKLCWKATHPGRCWVMRGHRLPVVLLVCDVHCRRRWWWDWILSLWYLGPSCHPSLSCTFPDTLRAAPALPRDECLLWHDGTRHPELPVVPRHTFTVTASEVQVKYKWGHSLVEKMSF